MFFQSKFIGDHAKYRLANQGKERSDRKHQAGLLLVKMIDVMQPDGKEGQNRTKNEKVEEAKTAEYPEILVFR